MERREQRDGKDGLIMAGHKATKDVSEQSGIRSSVDVLRLYEKWLRTGSARDGQRLADQGILPNASIGQKFLQ